MVGGYPLRYNDDGLLFPKSYLSIPPLNKYDRCGIIPYYKEDNETFFILGVSRDKVNQVCGFGGKSNLDENWTECALREFDEESYSLISKITEEQLFRSITIHSQKCTLSFVEVDTIDEYYNFDMIKQLAELAYIDNMQMKKKCDKWETLTFEKFNLDEMENLLNRNMSKGKQLWEFDRIMIYQCWENMNFNS